MKLISAVIKPFLLDDVRDALVASGIHGLIVAEVKGFGRQRGHVELYHGAEYAITLVPKIRVEVAVADDVVQKTIEAICGAARTGQVGDGKIFVFNVEHVVRIRTGEIDNSAL
jgi:nitrogen regulatory protein P-II 2